MIKTNIAVLMAERGLKIADVYNATGISKTTLMSLADSNGKGVQFETINTLCIFLGVTPAEFFLYVPLDFEYIFNFYDLDFVCNDVYKLKTITYKVDMILKINEKHNTTEYTLSGCVTWENIDTDPYLLPYAVINFDNKLHQKKFEDLIKQIPTNFYRMMYDNIMTAFKHQLQNSLDSLLKNDNKHNELPEDLYTFFYDNPNIPDWYNAYIKSDSTLFNRF